MWLASFEHGTSPVQTFSVGPLCVPVSNILLETTALWKHNVGNEGKKLNWKKQNKNILVNTSTWSCWGANRLACLKAEPVGWSLFSNTWGDSWFDAVRASFDSRNTWGRKTRKRNRVQVRTFVLSVCGFKQRWKTKISTKHSSHLI